MMGIGSIFDFADSVVKEVGKFIPDKTKMAEFEANIKGQAINLERELAENQTNINAKEAEHARLFVSGWRPFVGWVCGAALAYQTIGFNLLAWASVTFGMPMPPGIETGMLENVLMLLLGFGGVRSVEKLFGKAAK